MKNSDMYFVPKSKKYELTTKKGGGGDYLLQGYAILLLTVQNAIQHTFNISLTEDDINSSLNFDQANQ